MVRFRRRAEGEATDVIANLGELPIEVPLGDAGVLDGDPLLAASSDRVVVRSGVLVLPPHAAAVLSAADA